MKQTLKRIGLAVALVALLLVPTASHAISAMTNYRTFSREILTPDQLNALQTAYTNKLNEIIALTPGDSLKVVLVATDTLTTKASGKITVKDPLVSVSASDSLFFHLANIKRVNGDTIWLGAPLVTPVFAGGGTAGKRWRFNLADIDSLRLRDSLNVMPGSKTAFLPGSIFTAAAIDVDSLTGGNLATGVFNIGTATNWQLGGVAYTGTMANLNTLRDDSMADALHRHSELSASDGTPNPAASVDGTGLLIAGSSGGSWGGNTTGQTVRVWGANSADNNGGNLQVLSADAQAADKGGSVVLGGLYHDGGTTIDFAAISGRKDNGTSNNTGGYLTLATRAAGGNTTERLRITSAGNVGIGTTSPEALAHIASGSAGTIAATSFTRFIIEGSNTTSSDLQFQTPNAAQARIVFGDTDDNDVGLISYDHATNVMSFQNNAATTLALGSAGQVYINETSNANSTIGLTITQGANDDAILALKSSDIAHGMTAVMETDTYGQLGKGAGATGGVLFQGITEATESIFISGYATTENTTHTAAGDASVIISSYKVNGASPGTHGANTNVFAVSNSTAGIVFIVDAEGDLFADGSAPTIYDAYDDVALISAFDKHEAKVSNQQIVESEWEDYTRYNEKDLIEMGIIGGPRVGVDPSKRGLINYTGMVRLHNGAIRQVGRSVNELDFRTESVEARLARLEMNELFYSPTIMGSK